MPVRLCLAALPGQRLDDIERVYSHIQALGQAEAFLRSRPWQLADDLQHGRRRQGDRRPARARRGGRPLAAGGGARSASRSSPTRSATCPDNRTRFVVLVARPDAVRTAAAPATGRRPAGGRRSSFGVRNEPGTLLAALRVFADRG